MLFALQWSVADVMLATPSASNSCLWLIATYLLSGEDLLFFGGATLLCYCRSLLWLYGCLLVAAQGHLQPLSHGTVTGVVPPLRTQQEAGAALPHAGEKARSLHLALSSLWPGWEDTLKAAYNRASKGFHIPIFLHATGMGPWNRALAPTPRSSRGRAREVCFGHQF